MRKLLVLAILVTGSALLSSCGKAEESNDDPKVMQSGLNGMNPEAKAKEGGPTTATDK
ncbi:MAG: hypothetical protein JNJ45_11530 [Chthonomonas sp.]|nr:hypothetical protein [Chthonomonas sp.]